MYNKMMKTTSHFVGIPLDSSRFVELFVDLQKYFRAHGLEGALELQNILSLHITLYYLESSIDENEKTQIMQDITKLYSDGALGVAQLKGTYFGEPGKERICYLGCPRSVRFEEINQFFVRKYNYSQIPENQLAFVPHISLFRINDPGAYAPHKVEVDKLIDKTVGSISCDGLIKGLYLFQVSSLFHPEIQIPII